MSAVPEEHPDTTAALMRSRWLAQDSQRLRPETLLEFLQQTDAVAREWYERWHGLWRKVNPAFFRDKTDRERWLREQEWKSLAAWHLWRAQRMYWHEAGLWVGNPMDPDDKGSFVVSGFEKAPKRRASR